ncbi:beta-lactamase/transpeptidase-like protein [Annulohypoxylon truncatum]|uniref:beta-lactamase/transpeptidase-like protein n=1 Tax=Annulohypoxylon truncatum TaxID=327061 RepID=UPI002007DD20|nr:beta-lactamase/transpeptidase-like protein [Annulohypoxylon truncatum]KAI1210140.1 beta-lactamase/transpeptidase-like protein [Annulohypoxylon truncatum]
MKSHPSATALLLLAAQALITPTGGIPNCPYPGPAFPKPRSLASSDAIKTAIANLTTTFNARGTDPAANPNSTSWSIQVFSASDADEDTPLWSHYHTATDLLTANTPGVKSVDGDTVYRLGSVTKIFTILTFLIEAGDTYWNTPVTQWVPELELLAGKAQYDPVMNVEWETITLQDLASHLAGIVRDYAIEGELTQENNQTVLEAKGFPPAPRNETPTCGEMIKCPRAEFFTGLSNVPPSFSPSWTAGYSNMGYQILSYALEAITQKQFAPMLQSDIIDKLELQHTFYQKPDDDSLGVIPEGHEDDWSYSIGEASPTGNMYSSASDLSRLGRAIFRHTLLAPAQTRRWLKPTALTSDIHEGVSSPWGIRRIPLSDGSRVVDAYSKAGSINVYMSLLVLLPDYDVGISALLAGGWPGNANWDIADNIGRALLPALEDAAREEADANYAGIYTAAGDADLNSTLVLSTDAARPGLGVDRWVSNGTDMIPVAVRYTLNYNVTAPSIRIYPTGLESAAAADGTRKIAFKAVVENLDLTDHSSAMFSTNCGTWVSQTAAVYADMPLDQFVFTLGEDGRAVSVTPLALRTALLRNS